jgi:predicted small lipoprotein YifL
MRLYVALCVIGLAFGLSACGKRGTLERPPPLWGEPAAAAAPAGK